MYSHTYDRAGVYDELPSSFETTGGVQHKCPIYAILFKFAIIEPMENALDLQYSGVELANGEKLRDLDYTVDLE